MSMLIQKDSSEHEADLMFSIHSDLDRISEEQPDIVMVCAGGKQILTNRYLLGLWSPLVRDSCVAEMNTLLLPDFSESCTETVVRLLSPGWEEQVVTQEELRLMECLGVWGLESLRIWGLEEEGELDEDQKVREIDVDSSIDSLELETNRDLGKSDQDVIKPEVKKGKKTKTANKITFLDCDQCKLKFLDDNSLNKHKKEHDKGPNEVWGFGEEEGGEADQEDGEIKINTNVSLELGTNTDMAKPNPNVIKPELKKGMKGKSKKETKITFLDCDQCNLKFLDDNSLNNHKKEHKKGLLKVKEEKLDEDEISENKTKKVSRDTTRVHTTGRKPKFTFLDCDHCKLKFMDERALKMHVIQSHKKDKKLKDKLDENSSDETINEDHDEDTTEEIEAEYTPENLLDSYNEEVESKETLVESKIYGMDKPKENPKVSNQGKIKPTKKIVFIDCNQCNKKFLDEKGLASHRITTHREKV